jgi:hypothetical protein
MEQTVVFAKYQVAQNVINKHIVVLIPAILQHFGYIIVLGSAVVSNGYCIKDLIEMQSAYKQPYLVACNVQMKQLAQLAMGMRSGLLMKLLLFADVLIDFTKWELEKPPNVTLVGKVAASPAQIQLFVLLVIQVSCGSWRIRLVDV